MSLLATLKYSGIVTPRGIERLETVCACDDIGILAEAVLEVKDGPLKDQRLLDSVDEALGSSTVFLTSFCAPKLVFDLLPLNDHCPSPLSKLFIFLDFSPEDGSMPLCALCLCMSAFIADKLFSDVAFALVTKDGVLSGP